MGKKSSINRCLLH